ncbi:MAG: AAA family ATPase [Paracoccaceae bacterium]
MKEIVHFPGKVTQLNETADRTNSPDVGAIDVFLILKRQKWPLVIGALFGMILGIAHYATSPKVYYAASTILVSEQTNSSQELNASFPALRDETAVLNEMQVLRSLLLAERVVEKLALHENAAFLTPPMSMARQAFTNLKDGIKGWLPFLDTTLLNSGPVSDADRVRSAALILQRDIGLLRVGRTFTIEISAVLSDPVLATEIVNTYSDVYLEDRQISNLAAADRSVTWLRTQIEEVRKSANVAAAAAEAFRTENGASNNQVLRQLEQRAATLNDLHAVLLSRLELVAVEGSFPATNGRLLSSASIPIDPALPKAWRLLAIGIVIGLTLGLMAAVWREMHETGCRSGDDILRHSGLPFLGYLPRYQHKKLQSLSARMLRSSAKLSRPFALWLQPQLRVDSNGSEDTVPLSGCAPSYLLPIISPDARYCETIKNVLATVPLIIHGTGCQVIAMGSLNQGDGRSTVCANIAQTAAMEGKRVLLIDAELSNPELSRNFGFDNEAGLHDVLEGRISLDDATFHLAETGLRILPGRVNVQGRPATGLSKLPRVIEQARAHYDLIVIDLQPVGVSSSLKTVLPLVDGIVWVADWGRTSKQGILQFTQSEPQVCAKALGVVLNRTVTHKLPHFGVADAGVIRKRDHGFA